MTHYISDNRTTYPSLIVNSNSNSTYATIAKISFFVFLFFIIFGTSLPFRERINDVEDIGSSNIINQIVFALVFVGSSLSLIPKSKDVVMLIKQEKYLFLFLLWCTFSVIWSDYSFVSFKRLFRDYTVIIVCLGALFHCDSIDEIHKYFKYILFLYIALTVLSIILIPGAIDRYGNWRGLAPHKNHLGQVSLISSIIWFYAIRIGKLKDRFLYSLMLLLSLILLFGSESMTSILTFSLLVFVSIILSVDDLFKPLQLGRSFSCLMIISFFCFVVTTILWAPDVIHIFFDFLGKDLTFTGRTEFWSYLFEETQKYLIIGCGFGGFWVVENKNLILLYKDYDFSWFPNQAHNGYLDILNETGIVGLFLFFMILIVYFKNITKLKNTHVWKWFLLATLILNLQESTLFRHGFLTGMMFIFAYLALYIQITKENIK